MRRQRQHGGALAVWTNGQLVGHWRPAGAVPTQFEYDPAWMQSREGRPLSLSLPFPVAGNVPLRGTAVQNFFDNLLPDNEAIRKRLAQRYAKGSVDTFDLLQAIGRDCVGALQLVADGDGPDGCDRIEGEPLSDEDIAQLLRDTVAAPYPGHQGESRDFRISIAGAQEKTALLWHEGRWWLPTGATPTTQILKMPLGLVGNMRADLSTSVYNEWLCLKLCAAFGLPTAEAAIVTFADHVPVLAVERFDRRLHPSGTWIIRLPQEDFCQVLGLGPAKKYEADGGPGIQQIANVLQSSRRGREDLGHFLKSQILFWLMAATDGHAKNFSIHLLSQGAYELTPMYDVLSAWPIIGRGKNQLDGHRAKLAMAVRGATPHYELKLIQRRHFNTTAARCGWGANAEDLIAEVLSQVDPVLNDVSRTLPQDFPAHVADSIFNGMRQQAARLAEQPLS